MKIVIDSANGAFSFIAEPLFTSLGAKVIAVAKEPDGCNINDGCGSTYPANLQQQVLDYQADAGFAFDGDGDRIIAVDEKGSIVDGDAILAIAANALHQQGNLKNNMLVVTQMSNMGLRLAMEEIGVVVEETQVGDRYVLERMLEKDACIGGEQSGHIILADYNFTGDGLAAALYILAIMAETGKPLSELAKVMTALPQILSNVPVSHKYGLSEDEDIMAEIQAGEEKLAGKGRILVRPSGTEQLLRVMAEGENIEVLEEIVANIVHVIREKRGI